MPKGSSKSSASAGTRKKYARKAAGQSVEEQQPTKTKNKDGKKKGNKKEPRQKIYIPPIKPAPVQPDPLETTGLAHRLPPDLLIVLRSLAKKATVTKSRALEDLQSKWLERGEDEDVSYALVEMVPVWMHHLPALFVHPSRRVRQLAAALQSAFLQLEATRRQIIFFLSETASTDQVESVLGSWVIAAHDVDRGVSSSASVSWQGFIKEYSFDKTSLLAFVQRGALDPNGVHSYLNPPAPVPPPPPSHAKRAHPRPSLPDSEPSRSKMDETEEDEQDRKARIRIGAIGALRWLLESTPDLSEELVSVFTHPTLWSSLHPAETCPFAETCFGFGQPLVRKFAWSLGHAVLQKCKGKLDPILPILSTAILRSAWVDTDPGVLSTMWQPLLIFLKEHPEAWELDLSSRNDDDSDSDEGDESSPSQSLAYREFLQFLEMGCNGAPLQGYPAIVVILSTIPSSIFASCSESPLRDFLNSFWAAIDGRALRSNASQAYLSSLLECLAFLSQRIERDESGKQREILLGVSSSLPDVVREQFGRIWAELKNEKVWKDKEKEGSVVGRGLKDLSAELFEAAWTSLSTAIMRDVNEVPTMTAAFLRSLKTADVEGADTVISGILNIGLEQSDGNLLAQMMHTFGTELFDINPNFTARIDDLVQSNLGPYDLLFAYLNFRNHEQRCLAIWRLLLRRKQEELKYLVDAAKQNVLPGYLMPESDELDEVISGLMVTNQWDLVIEIFRHSSYFLSPPSRSFIISGIVESFVLEIDQATGLTPAPVVSSWPMYLKVFKLDEVRPHLNNRCWSRIFILAYLIGDPTSLSIWESNVGAQEEIQQVLKELLLDTGSRFSPEDILDAIQRASIRIHPMDILPTRESFEAMIATLSADPIDPSLVVVEPLLSPASANPATLSEYDDHGFSSYARAVTALVRVFNHDRQTAKENIWALRHLIALSIYAEDAVSVPYVTSDIFTTQAGLTGLREDVQRIITYLLLTSDEDQWRKDVVSTLIEGKRVYPHQGTVAEFVAESIERAAEEDQARECRILRRVLKHVLDGVDKEEADHWVLLSRKLEKSAPEASMVIISSVSLVADSPKLDRYRNELAASLLGTSASKADTEGLLTLRKLCASAPPMDSDVVFLSGPRAVNALKVCQEWVMSDDGVDEEVESVMTLLFAQLVPILQNVPGKHWDFIFDVIENNLENSSLTEDETLPTLDRTLALIVNIDDLAFSNKSLRADWDARKMPILKSVRDLGGVKIDAARRSIPKTICRNLFLTIVRNFPESLVDFETLPQMCHLLNEKVETSTNVPQKVYPLLEKAAKKRTEHFVIEVGVDTDDSVKAEIPKELLDILQQFVSVEDTRELDIFGYLLGWMLVFDLFHGASLKVRMNYIEQLRALKLVSDHFMPAILSILRVSGGVSKAFKLDLWAVDEYYVQQYEPFTDFSLQTLAAHVYYRALLTVPSIIYSWVLNCKDRQVSSTIIVYTSSYFSPSIISQELSQVKDNSPTSEDFSVKVASAVNEVIASYQVDEHQLEIKFKIPIDWPLHRIEIRDVKRVGVDESRWRAWILAVQQTLWSQNGRITDGLELFKKNVTLHFEGQAECAICYSIISVMDGTLPRKKCKTCKNGFHAGCLYKWFNTSHSSSCPLCRSDIL